MMTWKQHCVSARAPRCPRGRAAAKLTPMVKMMHSKDMALRRPNLSAIGAAQFDGAEMSAQESLGNVHHYAHLQ